MTGPKTGGRSDGPKFQFVLSELIGVLEKSVKEALGKDSELLVNRIMENVKGGIVRDMPEICRRMETGALSTPANASKSHNARGESEKSE